MTWVECHTHRASIAMPFMTWELRWNSICSLGVLWDLQLLTVEFAAGKTEDTVHKSWTHTSHSHTHLHCLPRSVIMTFSVSWTKLKDGIAKPPWPKTPQGYPWDAISDDFQSRLRLWKDGMFSQWVWVSKTCGTTHCSGHWRILDSWMMMLWWTTIRWLVEKHTGKVIPLVSMAR